MAKYIYRPTNKVYPPECGMGWSEIIIKAGTNKAGIPAGHYIVLNAEQFYTYRKSGVDMSEQSNTIKDTFEGDAEVRITPNWHSTNKIQWQPFP